MQRLPVNRHRADIKSSADVSNVFSIVLTSSRYQSVFS
ncbi:hypothetical protein FHR59_002113 [Xanthomonas arboricola]|nr:hypothetical protein [Xanthomonas arboricola]